MNARKSDQKGRWTEDLLGTVAQIGIKKRNEKFVLVGRRIRSARYLWEYDKKRELERLITERKSLRAKENELLNDISSLQDNGKILD